ncbi:trehalose 6-phosphate phosphatase [Microbacterium sp. SORGH_AS 505]|uniref:trehalose-phosphatase n=1 Tax=Microbacterium sp. SORGH_AS_0505 TaxID=3041770 RepID=UPI0027804679|nr:trehalose-phosphatase [Microbacterium sp. SORGH_AS_0505]MDQ1127505.1 trehalose 6-phosphate phosphatase [Microbacterium sp. SORGH_AS_0505]
MSDINAVARTKKLLVALDFDGTLSPLVDEPMSARMAPAARAAVDGLVAAPATVVAFVSGRSLGDLRIIAEHSDDSPILLAGSHGAEYLLPGADSEAALDPGDTDLRDRLRTQAEESAREVPGAWIEPKTFGFGVHLRTVSDPSAAERLRSAVDALVADAAPHWRRRQGHGIVEYAFTDVGKDAAVAHLRDVVDASAVIFAGDDVTDEDALRSLGPDDLGIRVGAGETAASVRVGDIEELAALLSTVARERVAAQQ